MFATKKLWLIHSKDGPVDVLFVFCRGKNAVFEIKTLSDYCILCNNNMLIHGLTSLVDYVSCICGLTCSCFPD